MCVLGSERTNKCDATRVNLLSGRLKKKKDAHMMLYITHVNFQGLEIILQGVLREERR